MMTAQESLDRLREGNSRFVRCLHDDSESRRALQLPSAEDQRPFAIVLGCSDSRVPMEIVFDQGFGDLFVIRIAGNVVASSQIGSVEFAAASFGTPLVVVVGHSHCGAVRATLDHLQNPQNEAITKGTRAIIERIAPAIRSLVDKGAESGETDVMAAAVRMNVLASVEQLASESSVLRNLVAEEKLSIVGAEYSLETGVVEFLSY